MASEQRKEYQREYHRNWYQENKKRTQEHKLQWYAAHPDYKRDYARRRNIELRQAAIRFLGGTCVCCQCTDIRCLEIDHIIPVGKKRVHRDVLYRSVLRGNTENLQVLCACCHAIKTYESYYSDTE